MVASTSGILAPPAPVADENLVQSAARAIRATCVRPIANLIISADRGLVTLSGRARTFYEKQLLVHSVRHVPGVRQVIDHLDVLPANVP